MSYTIKNNTDVILKIRSFLYTEEIPAKTWHTGDKTSLSGGDFDIGLEAKSDYFFEIIMNPNLIHTTVSKEKQTEVNVTWGGCIRKKANFYITISDKKGRNERHEVEVDCK